MGKYDIRIRGDVKGVVANEGTAFVDAGGDAEDGVRAAVARLLTSVENDADLGEEQVIEVRELARELQRSTAKPRKRWDPEAVRRLLADITLATGTAGATATALQAVREAVGALL